MKRWLPHIGIVIGIAIAVYALFFTSSDEDRIREKLARLEDAVRVSGSDTNIVVRAARIKKEFAEIFDKQVTIEIPELTEVSSGRAELVQLAGGAPQMWRSASVDLGGLSVDVDQHGSTAVAYGQAVLTATTHGNDLNRDERTVSLRFDKIEGDWLIVQVSVSTREGDGFDEGE